MRVPFREIVLSEKSGEPPFRLYDSSGPYTDADAAIDVERGLPKLRASWIAERTGAGEPVTQLEFARAGIITPEMEYIAIRETLGRAKAAEEASARLADGESFGASIPEFVTPEFVRARSRGDAPSFRPISITPNPSR